MIALPAVMGVLNVTPDSFSDGGCFLEPERALAQALTLEAEGAAIIDVGGESTRPVGAHAVPVEVELARVVPVLELLRRKLRIPVSIDTRKAEVARAALAHGAVMINDVSALSADAAMAPLAAQAGCAVVLMHMRGSPENHMRYARYRDVLEEVVRFLRARARFARAAGINPRRIIVDPGLGFAKIARHNLALLGGLSRLCGLGYPVLI
ncbi:MAG: dihydropteroate synthase, partial [Candidatus Binataceae bacterium]